MIGPIFSWWAVSTVLAIAGLPLTWRLFHRLSDRGYGFARALGLMATGYILWLGASLGLLRNSTGGIVAGVVLLAGLSLWAGAGRWSELRSWLRLKRRSILIMEILFLAAFIFWAFVRSNNPEITGTEKPMELAFLNSILRSESFPPRDPWLSGFAISYYYFGYVLLALFTRLSGVASGVAFNLGNSLWFALALVGTYSLIYNLIGHNRRRIPLSIPLLGPLFVVISGNLEGFLDSLHSRQLFWTVGPDGTLVSSFWRFIGLKSLIDPPVGDPSWIPNRFWWWWRASRVVTDIDLQGNFIEVIDEFPFFSFLLADNHPHLLAFPFVLMAIAFALQIYLTLRREEIRLVHIDISSRVRRNVIRLAVGAVILLSLRQGLVTFQQDQSILEAILALVRTGFITGVVAFVLLWFAALLSGLLASLLSRVEFFFAAWLLGGLVFLNTWDLLIFLGLLVAVLVWTLRTLPIREMFVKISTMTLGLIVLGGILYLPWYPSFTSQAGLILPNLIFPTRLTHFLIMFGTSFIPIIVWLIVRASKSQIRLSRVAIIAFGVPISLLLFSWIYTAIIGIVRNLSDPLGLEATLASVGVMDIPTTILVILQRRATTSWTSIALGGVLGFVFVLLFRKLGTPKVETGEEQPVWPFVMLMVGVGGLLILGPEFLYLEDQFGTRMNTIFKFYFAAWILWGLSAAYALVELWPKRFSARTIIPVLCSVPLLLGLVYPVFALWTKTEGFNPTRGQTLDGIQYLEHQSPSDLEAIHWINQELEDGVIAEAVGPSYNPSFARISAHTGLSTVLGWPGHESQWRDGYEAQGTREQDVRLLYKSRDWVEAQEILDRYGIDFVYLGSVERNVYDPVREGIFEAFMDVIFQNEEVKIYQRRMEGPP